MKLTSPESNAYTGGVEFPAYGVTCVRLVGGVCRISDGGVLTMFYDEGKLVLGKSSSN